MTALLFDFVEHRRKIMGVSRAVFARDVLKCTPRFYGRLCRGECRLPVEMYERTGVILGLSANDCADFLADGSLTQKTLSRLVLRLVAALF